MKTFYFEDENGTYFSPKKTRLFKKLSGIEAYDYLNEEAQKGIKHRFLRFDIEHPSPIKEVDGYEPEPPAEPIIEKVFVEVRPEQVKKMRIGERRKQYVNQCVQKSGIETISLYAPLHDQEDITVEETVALPEKSVEDLALYEIELEILRGALAKLSDAEFNLIYSLFFSKTPVTEAKLAEEYGITQPAINQKKNAVIKKLKKYIKNYL